MRYRWQVHERPKTVLEAVALLQEYEGQARLIAGGTDLLIDLDQEDLVVPAIVDVTSIPSLDGIREREDCWEIGAGVSLTAVLHHRSLSRAAPHLMEAIEVIGSVQIRNVATLVGNVTNGSPAADGVLPLLTLDAEVVIVGPEGERIAPLKDFFIGPRTTICGSRELVVGLRVPKPRRSWIGAFEKVGLRQAMAIAVVNVAANVVWADGTVADARIALGAVAPTPILAQKASKILRGTSLEDEAIERASRIASGAASPINDVRAGARYRSKMVQALTRRCLHRIRIRYETRVGMVANA